MRRLSTLLALATVVLVPVPSLAADPPPQVPALYAKVFQKGQQWSYAMTYRVEGDFDERGKPRHAESEKYKGTCRVVAVRRFKAAVAARVDCGKEHESEIGSGPDLVLPGTYILEGGSVHLSGDDLPADERALKKALKDPIETFEARPRPGVVTGKDAQGQTVVRKTTTRGKGGFCFERRYSYAHELVHRHCFTPAAGFVEAHLESHGGQSTITTARLTPAAARP